MPKQIFVLKDFILKARKHPSKKRCTIKKTTQGRGEDRIDLVKFKLKTQRYLYTLVVRDMDKADRIRKSFPPELEIVEVDRKRAGEYED